jgi:hypothetical protein
MVMFFVGTSSSWQRRHSRIGCRSAFCPVRQECNPIRHMSGLLTSAPSPSLPGQGLGHGGPTREERRWTWSLLMLRPRR